MSVVGKKLYGKLCYPNLYTFNYRWWTTSTSQMAIHVLYFTGVPPKASHPLTLNEHIKHVEKLHKNVMLELKMQSPKCRSELYQDVISWIILFHPLSSDLIICSLATHLSISQASQFWSTLTLLSLIGTFLSCSTTHPSNPQASQFSSTFTLLLVCFYSISNPFAWPLPPSSFFLEHSGMHVLSASTFPAFTNYSFPITYPFWAQQKLVWPREHSLPCCTQ